MLIECPNCDTQFSVPDNAIGENGRNLKCAKCAYKWFYKPAPAYDDSLPSFDTVFDVAEIAAELEASMGAAMAEPEPAQAEYDAPPRRAQFESSPGPSPKDFAMEDDAPRARSQMFAEPQQPIPDVFTRAREPKPRSGGGWGLFLFLVLVVVGGLAAAATYFQDRVIAMVPEAAPVYDMVGLRHESLGAGLNFRNYSSERPVQDGSEILIVRGIIANTTDKQRDVPMLRLALFGKGDNILQEKIVKPPAQSLDAGGTVGFRISLEQPNPEAVRFELTFSGSDGK
jgi:predicted Zn finger-like uncharacterized protein